MYQSESRSTGQLLMSIGFQESLNINRVTSEAVAISKNALKCNMRTFLLNLEMRRDKLGAG